MGSLLMKDWGAIRSTSWWREKGGARQEMEREIEGVGGGGTVHHAHFRGHGST